MVVDFEMPWVNFYRDLSAIHKYARGISKNDAILFSLGFFSFLTDFAYAVKRPEISISYIPPPSLTTRGSWKVKMAKNSEFRYIWNISMFDVHLEFYFTQKLFIYLSDTLV